MMNPGTSMEFDSQALAEQDEAEMEREDKEREQELRELLSKALPDDLLEDDTISLSSHDSSLVSGKESPSPKPTSQGHWQQQNQQQNLKQKGWHDQMASHNGSLQQQTSTPIDGNSPPPPLETPASVAQQNGYADNHYEHGNDYQNGDVHQHNGYANGYNQDYEYTNGDGANYKNHDYNQHQPDHYAETNRWNGHNGYHNGNMEYNGQGHVSDEQENPNYHMGNNSGDAYNGYYNEHNGFVQHYENGVDYHDMGDGQYNGYMEQPNGNEYVDYSGSNEDHHSTGTAEQNGYHYDDYNEEHPRGHSQQEDMTNGYPTPGEGFHPSISPKERSSMPELSKVHEDVENYKVQYRAHVGNGHPENGNGMTTERFVPPNKVIIQDKKADDFERLQKEFLSAGGLADTRQLAQIQILYKARGRKLEEITSEIEIIKEEKARETRILNHKLAVSEGERQGMASGLQQVQQLLQSSKQETVLVQGKLSAAESQIHSLTTAKTEIMGKLQMAEATIESLNHQLMELGKSESLSRARDQHDAVVASMQRKYEYDLCEIRENLDHVKAKLEQQVEENESLKKQLSEVIKGSERNQIDHTETINKLAKNLEDSQKQCRELLETGSVQEISQLKIQLQQANTARNISEGMYQALQDELSDLKEQLQLYESAAHLGVYSKSMEEGLSDSFAHLNVKQKESDWKTPKLHRMNNTEDLSSDDLISGLKTELERSLSTIRSKRGQVTRLQNELKTTKGQTEDLTNRAEKSEKLAKDYEVKLRVLEKEVELLKPSPGVLSEKEREFKKEKDRLTQVYEQLKTEHEDLQQRFRDLTESEEKMNELNCELKKEMAQMVSEYDEDKRVALDRCQNACLQLHEDSTQKMRADLEAQLESEKQTLQEAHRQQIAQLDSELENAVKEVDDVKQLYINICEEKTKVELKLRDELTAEHEEKLTQVREKLQNEKEDALEQLRQSLEESLKTEMKTAEQKWHSDHEEEFKKQVDAKIAVAKLEWLEEHNKLRQSAAENAVSAAEREWKVKLETEIEEGVEKKLQQMKESGKNGFDPEHLKRALSAEKETLVTAFEEEKARAVETAVALAEVEWLTKHQASGNEQLEVALRAAKESWKAEYEKDVVCRIEQERKKWVAEHDVLKESEGRLTGEEVKARIESAVSAAKEQWRNNHEQVLKVKMEEAVRKAKNEWRMQGVEDMSSKIKEALKEARERWHAQSKAEVIAKIDDAVRRAKLEWELNSSTDDSGIDLKAAIDKARQDWDEEHQRDIKKQISAAEQRMKANLEQEHNDEMTKAVSEAKASVWREVKCTSDDDLKKAMASLQQESQQLRDQQEQMVKKKISELKAKLEEEKATLIEEKNKEKKEALRRMQEKCDAEYSVFLDEHKETLKKTIKRCKEEFEKEKSELLQQKDEDVKAFLTEKERKWKGDYNSFLEKHRSILDETLDSARREWEKEVQSNKKKHKAEIQALQAGYDEKKKALEKKFGDKMSALKEELHKGYEAKLQKTCEEKMKKKEQQWQEERMELLKQLQGTEQELREVEKQLQGDLDELRQKLNTEESLSYSMEAYDKERSELRGRLAKANRELESCDEKLRQEMSQLQDRLDKEHKGSLRRMESKLAEQERNHTQTVDALTQQLLKAKQLVDKMEEKERDRHSVNMSTQTDHKDMLEIHGDGLQELREHYIAAVNKIRSDVILYINESRDRCAETVRSEVVKERHCTAKKLRKYYLQCLHQLLEEEKNGDADKDFDNVSASQKLAMMAKALEVTPECVLEKKKQGSKNRSSTGRSSSSSSSGARTGNSNASGKSQNSTGSSKNGENPSGKPPIMRRRNLSDEFEKSDVKKSSSSDRYLTPHSEERRSSSNNTGSSALKSVNSYETLLSSYIRNSDSFPGKYIPSNNAYKPTDKSQPMDYHSNKENIQYSPLTKPKLYVTDKPVNRPYDMSKDNSVSSLLQKYKVDPVTGNVSLTETPQQTMDSQYRPSRYDQVMSLPQEPREFNPVPEKLTPDSKDSSLRDTSLNTTSGNITLRSRSSSQTSLDHPTRSRSRPGSPVDAYRSSRSRDRLSTQSRSSSSDANPSFSARSTGRNRETSLNGVTGRQSRNNSPMNVRDTKYYSSSEMATPVLSTRNSQPHYQPTKLTPASSEERSYLIRPIREQNGPPDGQSNSSKHTLTATNRSCDDHMTYTETPKMPKPVPMMTRETQAPSPAPTNLSFVSMDTYNELPVNLESTAYKVLQDKQSSRFYETQSSERPPLRHHASTNYSTPATRISPSGQTPRSGIQTLPSRPQISTHTKQSDSNTANSGKHSFQPVRSSKTH